MSFSWHCFCFLSNKDFREGRGSELWLLEAEFSVYDVITAGRRLQDWEGQGPLLSPARVFPWVVGTLVIQQVPPGSFVCF